MQVPSAYQRQLGWALIQFFQAMVTFFSQCMFEGHLLRLCVQVKVYPLSVEEVTGRPDLANEDAFVEETARLPLKHFL